LPSDARIRSISDTEAHLGKEKVMPTTRHRLVVERLEQRLLLAANAWFEDSGQQLGTNTEGLALGDLDGDGDLDAYFGGGCGVRDMVYLNDGAGSFTNSGQKLNNGGNASSVELADLDSDGDLDAFVAIGDSCNGGRGSQPDRVWLNDGTGKFTDTGQRLDRSLGQEADLGDLDGDGDLDAIVANGLIIFGNVVEQANSVWLNDGSGVFTLGQELDQDATNGVALGDIDGDGDLDALFGVRNIGQHNHVWINVQLEAGDANRDGVFNQLDIVQILQSAKYQTGQPAMWAEGDFNRDGIFDQLDSVVALQTGKYGQA
jgi:hypothetical protein